MDRREFLKFPKTWFDRTLNYRETLPQSAEVSPVHILNRVTWGIRPEDLSQLAQMGVETYIDYQLNYDQIPDPLIDQFISSGLTHVNASYVELNNLHYHDAPALLTNIMWSRVFRAIYSERQLYERMVEFWTDHFHVPIMEFAVDKIIQDREAIRPKVLSTFRDLLYTVAQNTALLIFLNNDVNDKNHPNENFARELMELYTMGEKGGYSEEDVKEVARAFTGWTIRAPGLGLFYFNEEMHDTEEKTVLGHKIPAGGGIVDGLRVLDILSVHPSTANFICTKLCVRFVSDNPPQSLIDSTVKVFLDTEGDIRTVMRHILLSQEFMMSQGQKFRRPMEFLVAMLRVLRPGLQVLNPDFVQELDPLSHRPFTWSLPDGFPDKADLWMNTGGLLARWNLAIAVPHVALGWWKGRVSLTLDPIIPPMETVGALVDYVTTKVLFKSLPAEERGQLIEIIAGTNNPNIRVTYAMRQQKLPTLMGLVFASPDFQWC